MGDILLDTSGGGVDERNVAKAALDAAEEQLQSLCASHAGTFVSVERRGRAMEDALQELQATIKRAEAQVVNAQQALEQDDDKDTSLAVLSEKHRVRRRTLLQHSSLLELLELPSLMDACVRSNLYEEALSIAAFSNTLERRHGDSNDVVKKVILQIRSRQSDLRRHLLHRLKAPVTMPDCLEVVTALRRLNSIDLERQSEANLERVHAAMELRLQVDFLEARDTWLDSTPSFTTGRPSGAAEELLDIIERYRTRYVQRRRGTDCKYSIITLLTYINAFPFLSVFEVATQFNAIFRQQSSKPESTVSLLSLWTSRRIHSFLSLLSLHLASMDDAASLRDALEASVFFASSMGRLGADFTAQLPALFEPKMHALVVAPWKEGSHQLIETLKICADAGISSPLLSHDPEPVGSVLVGLTEPQPPPRVLMSVPPLARFVNSILTGLNELRRCLLPGIFSRLRTSLDELLQGIQVDLQANERSVLTPGLRGDAKGLRAAAEHLQSVFSRIVEPYARGSLEAALGYEARAEHFHQILYKNERGPELVTGVEGVTEEKNDSTEESMIDPTEFDASEDAKQTKTEGFLDRAEVEVASLEGEANVEVDDY
jgi:conserved oligomeric Golgi complex subunit 8